MKRNESHPDLDALLKSETQLAIQRAVKSLPEDSLSLSWRSALNERLREVRPQSLWRSRIAIAWRPALGLALAGSLAIMMTLRTQPTPSPKTDGTLEASLVATYDDSANSEVLAGPGLAIHEVSDTTQKQDSSTDWTDSDVSSL